MTMAISPMEQRDLEHKLEASARALFASRLDHNLSRGGHGAGLANTITRHDATGGQLAAFVGRGIQPPTYEELQAHLGEGFGDWLKKGLSFASKAVKKAVNDPELQAAALNAATSIGKTAIAAAKNSEGGLKGGIKAAAGAAAGEAASMARTQAQDRIRKLMAQ